MKIKTGDTVAIIAGKNKFTVDKKGNKSITTGKVIRVIPSENKVVVEGVNLVKKHLKPTQQNQSGSIVEVEAPIHVSNVMLWDPKVKRPVRVKYVGEGKNKVRQSVKSDHQFK